ncbi:hypothetical protein FE784_26755 [Paenibacillus hemerocallicola]|uniref:Uncharacterized protein n=1 Tax=Paenibacillus hemerocallicola TaxID=1172614 RepID=A0A5C4T2I5_9BACL|nr:hypothetical protein [Paenibacillus hemerocallicola]TNJ63264.1 hypothetical protein FE784_26755 [Paenibacillus hemerocallicola]
MSKPKLAIEDRSISGITFFEPIIQEQPWSRLKAGQLENMRLLKKSARRGSAWDKRWGNALRIR